MTMQVLKTIAELDSWKMQNQNRVRAVVMTMGALHDGHAALINQARSALPVTGDVLVTIFVNPTQFSNPEDLAAYPTTLEYDLNLCAELGVAAVFLPNQNEIYPASDRPKVTVNPGALADELEGASRAGHFGGVLTVVNKLFALTAADFAFFGEKDYQQLTLIRHMVEDFNLSVKIVPVPTQRAHDGLALSSRNTRLSPAQRDIASQIPACLVLISNALDEGHSIDRALELGRDYLEQFPEISLDYLEIRDINLQRQFPTKQGLVLIAATVGEIRLIDNFPVVLTN
jgi:pantoate--beta-alanine ligase